MSQRLYAALPAGHFRKGLDLDDCPSERVREHPDLLELCANVNGSYAFQRYLARGELDPEAVHRVLRQAGRAIINRDADRLKAIQAVYPYVAPAIALVSHSLSMELASRAFVQRLERLKLIPAVVQEDSAAIYRIQRGRKNQVPVELLAPLVNALREVGLPQGEVAAVVAWVAEIDADLALRWLARYFAQ